MWKRCGNVFRILVVSAMRALTNPSHGKGKVAEQGEVGRARLDKQHARWKAVQNTLDTDVQSSAVVKTNKE